MTTEMQAAFKTYNPEPIKVPALAMYAVPKTSADLMRRWYAENDSTVRQGVEKLFPLARQRFERHAKWFQGFAGRGRVMEISGPHHLFLSNPREVVEQIDVFVISLR